MKGLIVIPMYNEEKNILDVLNEIKSVYDKFDILIIDDCSTDNSNKICRSVSGVTVINLPSNLGIGGARQTGFKYALYYNYDVVVQLDGDGQHNPAYISKLLVGIENGNNICIGSRFINFEGFQSSPLRRTGISFLNKLIKLFTNQTITDPTSGFRACDKSAIKLFANNYPQDYPEPESLVTAFKNNIKICEVPVKMTERVQGKSSIGKIDSVYFLFKVTIAIIIDLIPKK